jgi:hypothetical protein
MPIQKGYPMNEEMKKKLEQALKDKKKEKLKTSIAEQINFGNNYKKKK